MPSCSTSPGTIPNASLVDLNSDGVVTDNSGLRQRNTPENTFGVTTSYTVPVVDGRLTGLLSYRWRDEMEVIADNHPRGHVDNIDKLSATISYSWADERYKIVLQRIPVQRRS